MNNTMESETKKAPTTTTPSPDDELISILDLPVKILRHIATFLDFGSLLHFRLVSSQWNSACLPILMKRGNYNLTHPCPENERPDLIKGANHYSSWKISHSVYESAELLHDNEMWGNVRSLSIHQKLPLSREFHVWAWETIENRCPHLHELTFSFEQYLNNHTIHFVEVNSDYERAIKGLPNASFPNNKIFNLKNLSSVVFKGISEKTTAYFAQTLLQSTLPSLTRLHFCPITKPRYADRRELGAFRIFEYLQQNSTLTKNLQSFGFILSPHVPSNERDYEVRVQFRLKKKACELIRFVNRNYASIAMPLQFSQNLRTLFWDSPFHLDDQLLPGVLTPSIASSLVQLSLKGRVQSLKGEGTNNDNTREGPIQISFPNFPSLRALKLGLFAGRSLSLPELVDSAPNLAVLETIAQENVSVDVNEMRCCWRGAEEEGSVPSPKPHLQLRIFCTNSPFRDGLSTLQKISSKFPHLVELRLGRVEDVELDSFLSFVQSHHPELQRLSWSLDCYDLEYTLPDILRHVIRVSETLPSLTSYSFGCEEDEGIALCSMKELENSANCLLSQLSSSSLPVNLFLKFEACGCESDEEESVRRNGDCNPCYLRQFIRKHNLRILMPSTREMEEKFTWDNRFANSRIYK
jgi:hypothetical protein